MWIKAIKVLYVFIWFFKGRAGADGARGMPGEPGTKVLNVFLVNDHLHMVGILFDMVFVV